MKIKRNMLAIFAFVMSIASVNALASIAFVLQAASAYALPTPIYGNHAPIVANNAALSAHSVASGVPSVFRQGFSFPGDAPPVLYNASNSACALNSGLGDGGLQVPSADGKCWVAQFYGAADVRTWGALCANADNTAAVQKAVRNYLHIRIPECSINLASTVVLDTAGLKIVGSGTQSRFVTSSATANMLSVSASGIHIDGVLLTASTARTAGAYIALQTGADNFDIRNFSMYSWYRGISVVGGPMIGPFIHDGYFVNPAGSNSIGIDYNGSGANVVSLVENVYCTGTSSAAQPANCLRVRNVGDLTVRYFSTVFGGNAIEVSPQNGQYVQAMQVSDSWIDSGTGNSGVYVTSAGTGKTDLLRIADSWIASNTLGVTLSGAINEFDLDNSTIANNSNHAVLINLATASGTRIRNSTIAGNGGNGIVTAANATNITVANNTIGASGQFTGNGGAALVLGSGVTNTLVTGNTMLGNTGGSIGYSSPGANVSISNNLGFATVSSTGTVGASPATITAGARPSTYYFKQSATNTAAVTIGGNNVATMATAGVSYPIRLNPGESAVVTWATTAPTYTLVEQ